MPFRRRTFRRPYRPYRSRRRFGGSSRRRFRFRRRIPRNPVMRTAFPASRIVKMRYIENFTIDPAGSTAFASYVFKANSIFDPNHTGGGHQPMGRDQWATFYNHYTVVGAKISIIGITNSSSTPAVFGVRTIDLATTGHTTLHGLMETPTVSWRFAQVSSNGNVPKPAVAKYSAKKWFNLTNVKDNHYDVGAGMGSDPVNPVYFYCFYGAHDGSTDLPQIYLVAKITYIVLFANPRELAQS